MPKLVIDLRRRAIARGLRFRELGDALLEQLANVRIERADAQPQRYLVRDDVHRVPAVDRPYRHDGRLRRIDVTRDDRLERHHDTGGGDDWIDRLVRAGGMT